MIAAFRAALESPGWVHLLPNHSGVAQSAAFEPQQEATMETDEAVRVLQMIRDGLARDLAGISEITPAPSLRWARSMMQSCIKDIDRVLGPEVDDDAHA